MLALHDGTIEPTESVRHHLDLCLDCRACETACPSNVVYHELIEETRAKLPPAETSIADRLVRWTFLHLLPSPGRLKIALLPVRVLQRLKLYRWFRGSPLVRRLPAGLQKMEGMLPDTLPPTCRPKTAPRGGPVESAIAILVPTCVGSVMSPDINRKAAELLELAGCRVLTLPQAACCGAIHHHNGLHEPAARMARELIDAVISVGSSLEALTQKDWLAHADQTLHPPVYIVTTVAGCGAMLRDYPTLLRDDPKYAERARQFAHRVRDISELLAELKLPTPSQTVPITATYHDACHLLHGQKVQQQPRELLAKVPGLTMKPLYESDMCCGAAGTYNLTQPEMATALARRKLKHIAATEVQFCVTGNVGCAMHLAAVAREQGQSIRILHPVEVLHAAMGLSSPPTNE